MTRLEGKQGKKRENKKKDIKLWILTRDCKKMYHVIECTKYT